MNLTLTKVVSRGRTDTLVTLPTGHFLGGMPAARIYSGNRRRVIGSTVQPLSAATGVAGGAASGAAAGSSFGPWGTAIGAVIGGISGGGGSGYANNPQHCSPNGPLGPLAGPQLTDTGAALYFQQNPDVAAYYQKCGTFWGATAAYYASWHWYTFGQKEGRNNPFTLQQNYTGSAIQSGQTNNPNAAANQQSSVIGGIITGGLTGYATAAIAQAGAQPVQAQAQAQPLQTAVTSAQNPQLASYVQQYQQEEALYQQYAPQLSTADSTVAQATAAGNTAAAQQWQTYRTALYQWLVSVQQWLGQMKTWLAGQGVTVA